MSKHHRENDQSAKLCVVFCEEALILRNRNGKYAYTFIGFKI